MSTEKTFQGLPGWAKGIIAVTVVAGAAYGIYLLNRKLKSIAATRDAKKEVDSINADMNEAIKSGKKLTLSQSEIAGIANNLHTAMDGYGSNFDMIIKNMVRINNQVDFLAVVKSYGVRKISSGKGNPAPDFEGTLGQAFADELNAKELSAINLALAKKGIKHRF